MLHDAVLLQLGGAGRSVPALVLQSGPFGKGVLLLLLGISIYAWAVIWERSRVFKRVETADRDFRIAFRRLQPSADFRLVASQHPRSLLARVALAGQRALDLHPPSASSPALRYEIAQRAMDRTAAEEAALLEKRIGFLGTTGSVSPFIGLMGTVWGVMTAFMDIGTQGSASLVVVAPGIAEALITTIAGLAAAIPAVVGYNHLLGRLRDITNTSGLFANEFLESRAGTGG
jgi:biopolymer transport protein TolQ